MAGQLVLTGQDRLPSNAKEINREMPMTIKTYTVGNNGQAKRHMRNDTDNRLFFRRNDEREPYRSLCQRQLPLAVPQIQ
jgi:hypothetical protein